MELIVVLTDSTNDLIGLARFCSGKCKAELVIAGCAVGFRDILVLVVDNGIHLLAVETVGSDILQCHNCIETSTGEIRIEDGLSRRVVHDDILVGNEFRQLLVDAHSTLPVGRNILADRSRGGL